MWSQLQAWHPTLDEVLALATQICERFTKAERAEAALKAGDDYLAHDIYFMRDALVFCVYENAVSWADAGVMLRVLKYWAFGFRGSGQHNYARECAEILVQWKYETTKEMRAALEKSWFVNEFAREGGWKAADLYVEQLNYWIKVSIPLIYAIGCCLLGPQRVFIAQGNGVTIEYIMKKGSACVEAFRAISHDVARFFGDPDFRRQSKEAAFHDDMRVLVEDMVAHNLHKPSNERRGIPAKGKKKSDVQRSAIFDVFEAGSDIWQDGKFTEFISSTCFDPAVNGYPITVPETDHVDERHATDTAFDETENPLSRDTLADVHGGEFDAEDSGYNALGGGDVYETGTGSE